MLPQSPPTPATGLLDAFTDEPALLEVAVVLFVLGLFWLVMWWASRIAEQSWERAWVFFKHEDDGAGPKLATRFNELINQGVNQGVKS